jgi:hypothetical protein
VAVNHAKDSVGPHKIPRKDGIAIVGRITNQIGRVDRVRSAVTAGGAAVQVLLVKVVAFFVLGASPERKGVGNAKTGRSDETVAGRCCGRIERTIVRDVIVGP